MDAIDHGRRNVCIERLPRRLAEKAHHCELMALSSASRLWPQLDETEALTVALLILGVKEHHLDVLADRLDRRPVRRVRVNEFVDMLHDVGWSIE